MKRIVEQTRTNPNWSRSVGQLAICISAFRFPQGFQVHLNVIMKPHLDPCIPQKSTLSREHCVSTPVGCLCPSILQVNDAFTGPYFQCSKQGFTVFCMDITWSLKAFTFGNLKGRNCVDTVEIPSIHQYRGSNNLYFGSYSFRKGLELEKDPGDS